LAKRGKKRYGWLWTGSFFFAVGYLVTAIPMGPARPPASSTTRSTAPAPAAAPPKAPRSPVYAIAALVALTIPFAARKPGTLRGMLHGLGWGLAGAAGISFGLARLAERIRPEAMTITVAMTGLTTLICCGATGAVFSLLAERRQRKLYGGTGA